MVFCFGLVSVCFEDVWWFGFSYRMQIYSETEYCRMLRRTDRFLENRPIIHNKIMVGIIYLTKELLTRTSPQWKIVQYHLSSNFVSAFIFGSCCNWILPKQRLKMVLLGSFLYISMI